ncbi:hypothetical protein U1Q18_001471 [Sarracenia purpurea var. burkii]
MAKGFRLGPLLYKDIIFDLAFNNKRLFGRKNLRRRIIGLSRACRLCLVCEQKIVIKLSMNGQKSRSKALQVIVSVRGVESFAVKDNNQVELTGEGVDAYELIKQLRKTKNIGFVELVSLAPVNDQKKPETQASVPAPVWLNSYQYGTNPPYYVY